MVEGQRLVENDYGADKEHTTYPRGHHPVSTSNAEGDVELTAMNGDKFDDEHEEDDATTQQHHTIGSARTPWYLTVIILLSEVMGTGILSLPYAAKTLGWASTIASVPLFAAFSAYSGWLLAQVQQAQVAKGTKLTSLAEASTHLLGGTFGRITKVSMLLNFGATAIYYMIATSNAMDDIIEGSDGDGRLSSCPYQRSLIAVIVLVLPCQCRDFHSISKYLSGPSTCAIVLMIILIMTNLLWTDGWSQFGESTTLWPEPGTTPLQYLQALSAFVFAYQGHAIFFELMAEMKESFKFPVACGLAYLIMCVIYGLTVIVAYGIRGANTDEFLPDVLAPGTTQTIVGVLVCLHICVSYVIAGQPLHMWLHKTFFPQTYQQTSKLGTIHWFVVTSGYLVFGYVIGNLIPFFADVQALIGSLFGAPIVFGFPVAYYLVTMAQKNNHHSHDSLSDWYKAVGWGNLVVCGVFLFVFTPAFCLLGTSGALVSIVRDAKDSDQPFQCAE